MCHFTGNKAKTPQPATFAFEPVARVRSGTAEYKKQGIRGRRHRVDVDCADWAHKDEVTVVYIGKG